MPSIIRLYDAQGENLIDSIAGEYEDAFSFETFEALIKAHREDELSISSQQNCNTNPVYGDFTKLPQAQQQKSKNAIIARVSSWDEKNPQKMFYSYYDATQLNRALFRTQKYLGKLLLHRIHVLNPLTNTEIVGDVMYFMVSCLEEDTKDFPNPEFHDDQIATAISNPSKSQHSPISFRSSKKDLISPQLSNISSATTTFYVEMTSPISNERSFLKTGTQRLKILTNQNALLEEVPNVRPLSAVDEKARILKSPSSLERITSRFSFRRKQKYDSINEQNPPMMHSAPVRDQESTKQLELERLLIRMNQTEKSFLQTPPQRRRSFSLANSPQRGSFQTWVHSLCVEGDKFIFSPSKELPQDIVYSDQSIKGTSGDNPGSPLKSAVLASARLTAPVTPKSAGLVYYNAYLIGTDTSFLDSTELRGLFALNCLDLTEQGIIEMPEVTVVSEDPLNALSSQSRTRRGWFITVAIYAMVVMAITLFSVVIYHQVQKPV